jgi:CBS domain-containing protein
MTTEVFAVLETDDLKVAIASLLKHHVGGLPVLGGGGLLSGILTLTDVLRAAVVQGAQPTWGLVRDQMSTVVLSVTPEMPLSEAAARMTVTRTRVMPVTASLIAAGPASTHTPPDPHGRAGDGTRSAVGRGRVLLGVLHLRDIRAAITHAEDGHGPTIMGDRFFLGGQTVRDMMRPPSATIHPDTELIGAVVAMQRADVHGLPVVGDGGGLMGVITVSDVLRAMLGVAPPVPDHKTALV